MDTFFCEAGATLQGSQLGIGMAEADRNGAATASVRTIFLIMVCFLLYNLIVTEILRAMAGRLNIFGQTLVNHLTLRSRTGQI